jgi:hypothetical protein
MKMPFGKYEGIEISQVPTTYLEWWRNQIVENYDQCEKELSQRENREPVLHLDLEFAHFQTAKEVTE